MSVTAEVLKAPVRNRGCPVAATVAVIGGKWKPLILFHLDAGRRRFSDLQRMMPNVSDRMLIRSLKELERDGIILRTVHAEVPVRVEYDLTDRGRSLGGVLQAMCDWGEGPWGA